MHIKRNATILELENMSLGVTLQKQTKIGTTISLRYMISEARKKRVNDIFKLNENVYAFDSTTIDLCLKLFPWANFRTHKRGIKIHTLYDIETQVSAFIHITEAKINDVKAMDVIPYESGYFYVFDRAYNDYHRLYKIHMMDSFFVVCAKHKSEGTQMETTFTQEYTV